MKKWKILIPSLVATASMPLIGLVGCGEPPQPEPTGDVVITPPENKLAIAETVEEGGRTKTVATFPGFSVSGTTVESLTHVDVSSDAWYPVGELSAKCIADSTNDGQFSLVLTDEDNGEETADLYLLSFSIGNGTEVFYSSENEFSVRIDEEVVLPTTRITQATVEWDDIQSSWRYAWFYNNCTIKRMNPLSARLSVEFYEATTQTKLEDCISYIMPGSPFQNPYIQAEWFTGAEPIEVGEYTMNIKIYTPLRPTKRLIFDDKSVVFNLTIPDVPV